MRSALDLQLEGSIVVFDEAHNLADAVNGAHSAVLTAAQAKAGCSQLAAYLQRYGSQLNSGEPAAAKQMRCIASKSATTSWSATE